MIQCPYCGAEMDENARFCPRCRSLLVAAPEGAEPPPYPRWRHPFTAFAVILAASAVLLVLSVWPGSRPSDTTTEKAALSSSPAAETENAGLSSAAPSQTPPAAASGEESPAPSSPSPSPAPPPPSPSAPESNSLPLLLQYEQEIEPLLRETDALTATLDQLLITGGGSREEASVKVRELQVQLQRIRQLRPPRVVQQLHNRLANSLAITHRGYQKLLHYAQYGDVAKLEEARKDIETGRQKREAVLAELAALKQSLSPPSSSPSPPPETPPAETPPPAPPAEETASPPSPPAETPPPEGIDEHGPCIPRRLVEVYPHGPVREKIINSFQAQYHSRRVCGEAPSHETPVLLPPPPPEGTEPEAAVEAEGANAEEERGAVEEGEVHPAERPEENNLEAAEPVAP